MSCDYFSPESPWGTLRPDPWSRFWLTVSRGSSFTLRLLGSWLPSRFALLTRRLARVRPDGPVDTVVWGQRLRLYPDRSVSEARILFLPWHWDYLERLRLRPWVRPGFTFVDVGANVESAVGAAPADGRLIRNSVNSGENRLAREPVRADAEPGVDEVVSVQVRTLASIVSQAGLERIDCLKVDVEGHERDVLEPFFAAAPPSLRPRLLLVELKPGADSRALESWILKQGYRVECRTLMNGLFRRADVVSPAVPATSPALRARLSAPPAHARSGETGLS